ncbi:TPA: LysR family transcriptional regulator [Burkholderia orbicola]|uniref:LysR family transcriptional regulator n=1 Tax=Burkholderia cenocepacia TaxID=95486 RepID=UPI000F5A1FE8|nr:LysR family transcriptional regulator [Burkholderia cenocepacia]RQV15592.1 LysR family transcriptional regulator [Burkholderia cenocepacia]
MIRDLRQLQLFLSVIQCGSVGRAADACGMTQPSLSRIIQKLEEHVGDPLFQRHATGMRLSPAGAALKPYAELIVSESERASRELLALRGSETGLVKIGSVASALNSVIPNAINRLSRQFPDLRFHVAEGLTDDLSRRLQSGELDLIVTMSLPESEEILQIAETHWQSGCHVIASATHSLRSTPLVTVADISKHRWVAPPPGTQPWHEWSKIFRRAGISTPKISVETQSIETMRRLISTHGYLGWMPEMLLTGLTSSAEISVLPVQDVQALRTFGMYCRRNGVLSVAAVRFIEELKKVLLERPNQLP